MYGEGTDPWYERFWDALGEFSLVFLVMAGPLIFGIILLVGSINSLNGVNKNVQCNQIQHEGLYQKEQWRQR